MASTGTIERRCPDCGHRLSRFNSGPTCFACDLNRDATVTPQRTRRRLPHADIIRLYRELGDSTSVARELRLPRSSVWYVIHRARENGELPDSE